MAQQIGQRRHGQASNISAGLELLMAHEHMKDIMEAQEGRASLKILLTLAGGTLLLTAWAAEGIYDNPFYPNMLALFAALLLGVPLVVQAAKDLYTGHMHMNELAALGVVAAFVIGDYKAAGAVSFFMIISVLIEHRTALGARKSIESLVRITPTRATKVTDDGEVEVDASHLQPGDVVRVRPGDNIPGDGRIRSGQSTVNQANITGESLPVDKAVGDQVFSGTINMTGLLDIEIMQAGQDTTLGRVQQLILDAEQTRTPIMRLIDRYALWYTPTVLMIAFIVWFFNKQHDDAMQRVIAMLVIACPCAIILATPTAMVAALSAAARLGVLVKNVTDLEVARHLSAIVFDKTGTLTTGQLSVTRAQPADGVDPAEMLRLTGSAEQNSRHPVARAVTDVARRARLELSQPTDFEEIPGRGVRATIGGGEVLIGRDSWLAECGVDIGASESADVEGLSLLYVVHNGQLLGWIGLEDRTRPDAAQAMDDLRELGMRQLVMVTGDRWSVARRVASEMHCTDVQAEVLPAEKLQIVDDLKHRGHIVAVIGDGVNDAPALAAGNMSIAMGAAGSDVAIHSASVALMNNNLNRIPFLITLSRKTIGVVTQNLGFAVVFIVTLLVLSAMGKINPILAVLFHTIGSIIVVFNSARLVRMGEDLEHGEAEGTQPEPTGPKPAPVSPVPPSAVPA
ncbi:MAG: hypothetical protein CMJ49_04745 [Planctomycetaceae bacterium]|nr:hypothetical protein [Planctomycetaceae bacterium]